VAATNQNLESLIDQVRFRKDLYYRLRGVTIHLPPLRERREDIPELAHYFLFRYNQPLGTSVQSISPEALELLQKYDWPGNVRELQSVIREALIVSAGPSILPEFLAQELHRESAPETEQESDTDSVLDVDWKALPKLVENWIANSEPNLYRRALEHLDRLLISRAMQQANGNQARAAEILGLSRVTLRAKLRAMKLSVEKVLTRQPQDQPT
jgi:two-component system nitrogen regulation response regulator GlnG